jgi:hypothetical protein
MVVCQYFKPGFLNRQAWFFIFLGLEKKSQAYKNFFPGLQKKISRPAKIFFQAYVFFFQVNIFGISGNIS